VLASASPRRAELLAQLGLEFEVRLPEAAVDEMGAGAPDEVVLHNALQKAEATRLEAGELLLAADTLVARSGRLLGKPNSPQAAEAMLATLSGQVHEVYTAVVVRDLERTETGVEVTQVFFRELSREEIASYVATGEPLDKAGAYGIQGRAAVFVRRIEGDYFNIVGLPLCLLEGLLKKFEYDIFEASRREGSE